MKVDEFEVYLTARTAIHVSGAYVVFCEHSKRHSAFKWNLFPGLRSDLEAKACSAATKAGMVVLA